MGYELVPDDHDFLPYTTDYEYARTIQTKYLRNVRIPATISTLDIENVYINTLDATATFHQILHLTNGKICQEIRFLAGDNTDHVMM